MHRHCHSECGTASTDIHFLVSYNPHVKSRQQRQRQDQKNGHHRGAAKVKKAESQFEEIDAGNDGFIAGTALSDEEWQFIKPDDFDDHQETDHQKERAHQRDDDIAQGSP